LFTAAFYFIIYAYLLIYSIIFLYLLHIHTALTFTYISIAESLVLFGISREWYFFFFSLVAKIYLFIFVQFLTIQKQKVM